MLPLLLVSAHSRPEDPKEYSIEEDSLTKPPSRKGKMNREILPVAEIVRFPSLGVSSRKIES